MTVTVFTKPDCTYCARAKAVLDKAGVAYEERNVAQSKRNADASVYFSGVATVPQIFVGTYHINGAEDLERLHQAGGLDALVAREGGADLPADALSDEDLAQGAEDVALRTVIPKSEGARDDDPEAWPILRFYKQFFGFWPNTFAYLHHWPEAYKLFVYCHNFSAVGGAKGVIGDEMMFATSFATSNAHGCSYCQAHSAAIGDEQSLEVVTQFERARAGNGGPDSPFGPFELALADIAAGASVNEVADALFDRVRSTADQAWGGPQNAEAAIHAVSMIAAAFGFLNVFNDLIGMQIEGSWAVSAREKAGIDPGRHGAEDENPNNLDYDLPEGGPSMQALLTQYETAVGDLDEYASREFGFTPPWFAAWPERERKRHAYLYGELMGERDHSVLPSELKHLMARVSAIAKGHDILAAAEAFMAHHVSGDQPRTLERLRTCFAAAIGADHDRTLFTDAERAALAYAWLSAQTPLTTPRRFVEPAIDYYGPKALVQLSAVCGLASLAQRFSAIAKPPMGQTLTEFVGQAGLETDTLALRYPGADDDARIVAMGRGSVA